MDKIIFNSFPRSGSNYLFKITQKFNDHFIMNMTFCGPQNECNRAPCICGEKAIFTKIHDLSFSNLKDFIHKFEPHMYKYIILVRENKYENVLSFEKWLKKRALGLYNSHYIYNLSEYHDNFIKKYKTDIESCDYFVDINDYTQYDGKRVLFIYTEDLKLNSYDVIVKFLKFSFGMEKFTSDHEKFVKDYMEKDKLKFTEYNTDEILSTKCKYETKKNLQDESTSKQ